MRRAIPIVLLLTAACAANQLKSRSSAADPEIVIEQLSVVAPAARNVSGGLTLHYRLHVRNTTNETVTLKRIDMNSIGYGSYEVGPVSRPFDVAIKPAHEVAVEFFTSGAIVDPSLTGANGPVTLRAVVFFDSPAGQLQTVVVQQVRPHGAAD